MRSGPHCSDIDDLRFVEPETGKVALFYHNKIVSEKELQRAIIAAAKWSSKVAFNSEKCKLAVFTTKSHEAELKPAITANNTRRLNN